MSVPKVYIKLQTPTTEMEVKAVDGAGQTASIIVGFKRYPMEESQNLMDRFQQISSRGTVRDSDELDPETGLPKKIQPTSEEIAAASQEMDELIMGEVAYLKKVVLVLEDANGKTIERTIPDTRTLTDDETLWGSADNAVRFLLQLYLHSSPWRVSLISTWFKAIFNTGDLSDSKNSQKLGRS